MSISSGNNGSKSRILLILDMSVKKSFKEIFLAMQIIEYYTHVSCGTHYVYNAKRNLFNIFIYELRT